MATDDLTRFVVRLLTREDRLLAWAEVQAKPKPQLGRASCPLFARGVTQFLIEEDGTVEKIAVHWPALDVARVAAFEAKAVKRGQLFDFLWIEPVWLVAGMANVVLPAVTVRGPVLAQPATAGLGVKT